MAKAEAAEMLDVVVVGAGPAGVELAARLRAQNPALRILLLEAEDRVGGRAASGLNVLTAGGPTRLRGDSLFSAVKTLKPARVRWERRWVSPAEVDWAHKDWIAPVPQWQELLREGCQVLAPLEISPAWFEERGLELGLKEPVTHVQQLGDSAAPLWRLVTPKRELLARQLHWCAGLVAFQNAYGKNEASHFFAANPDYRMDAADYRGGLELDLSLAAWPEFEAGFDAAALMALPVRHGGRLYLFLGAFSEVNGRVRFAGLCHAHVDLLADPKEVLSLQKSLRRSLKMILREGSELPRSSAERWVVSGRVLGHAMGVTGVLQGQTELGLHFAGDESLAFRQNAAAEAALQP